MPALIRKLATVVKNLALGPRLGDHNLRVGREYIERNRGRPGVHTTRSGLQYEVLREGDGGPRPSFSSRVRVHYTGTLVDGTPFDSSYRRGEPLSIGLLEVISGWREGIRLMSVGSRYRFVIPPDLAYYDRRAGWLIGPSATLVFEVELLAIETP
jgi:FKBP-type peptidyl-prolyl cis-trans isomerase